MDQQLCGTDHCIHCRILPTTCRSLCSRKFCSVSSFCDTKGISCQDYLRKDSLGSGMPFVFCRHLQHYLVTLLYCVLRDSAKIVLWPTLQKGMSTRNVNSGPCHSNFRHIHSIPEIMTITLVQLIELSHILRGVREQILGTTSPASH